jgi:hypothetical protein
MGDLWTTEEETNIPQAQALRSTCTGYLQVIARPHAKEEFNMEKLVGEDGFFAIIEPCHGAQDLGSHGLLSFGGWI